MENALSPHLVMASPPPTTSSDQRTHLSSFYYSLVAIASTVILLIAYNLIVVGWCWKHHQTRRRQNRLLGVGETSSSRVVTRELIPISKYRKEETSVQACDNECAVCLSVFLDDEEVQQLPKCKHSFHAACIDMWLYSHSNCPLCREAVAVPPRYGNLAQEEESHSQEGLPV